MRLASASHRWCVCGRIDSDMLQQRVVIDVAWTTERENSNQNIENITLRLTNSVQSADANVHTVMLRHHLAHITRVSPSIRQY